MGCDIHMSVEVFNGETNRWEIRDDRGPRPVLSAYFDEEENLSEDIGKVRIFEDTKEYHKALNEWWDSNPDYMYDGRNYDLFAILADVRNGRGFAGCKTGDGFVPIDDPRGVPEDASRAYLRQVENYGIDGHSHSWFTVQELLDYDWDQETKLSGVVGPKGFVAWKENGQPESWCGGVSGPNVKHVSSSEMESLIAEGKAQVDIKDPREFTAKYYTRVEWGIKYRDSVGYFLKTTVPALQKLGDPNKVRIVFFFDN
jgi:hypothetical protein